MLLNYRFIFLGITNLLLLSQYLYSFQTHWVCDASLEKGRERESKGHWVESIELYKEVLEQALGNDDDICASKACSNLARVYAQAGSFFTGLNRDSLKISPALFLEINLFDQARDFYEQSFEFANSANDSLRMAYALYGQAIVDYQTEHFSEAVEKYSAVDNFALGMLPSARSQGRKDTIQQLRSWNLNLRSLSFFELGKQKSDQQLLFKSLYDLRMSAAILSSQNQQGQMIEVYHNMAMTFDALDEPDSSLSYNLLSLKFNEEFGEGSLYNKSKSWYGLANNFYGLNRIDSAFFYLKKYNESHRDLIEQEQSAVVAQWLILFETQKKELEIKKLKIIQFAGAIGVFLLVIVLLIIWQKRRIQRKLANQKINDLLQQQEIHSLQGVLAGQEEERQRIATDLHDKLGAILGMVKLHFSAVEERIDDLRDDNKKQYAKANELLDQASTEVRNISHNLLSGVLVKFGLAPALHDLKTTVEATGKLKIQLILGQQMGERLSGEQELQIYRIVQELVSNILKHAKATEAVIQLNRVNGEINLTVEDNGVGFDLEAAKNKAGIGLKNLEARAAKLNATIHFDTGKGSGTTVSVDIPVENEKL
jgi:signal transduction histidine kinase